MSRQQIVIKNLAKIAKLANEWYFINYDIILRCCIEKCSND